MPDVRAQAGSTWSETVVSRITFELRTQGSNAREMWQARHGRVKRERKATAKALAGVVRPSLPCSVLLTRVAQSSGLDDDNLLAALKGVRDEVAAWLGVDDRNNKRVAYRYAQCRGAASVWIQFGEPVSGQQFELLGEPVFEAQPIRRSGVPSLGPGAPKRKASKAAEAAAEARLRSADPALYADGLPF